MFNNCRAVQAQSFVNPQAGSHAQDQVGPFAARAEGAPSRLVGLTWIDEWQTILVRPDSPIAGPEDLKGLVVLLASQAGAFITGQTIVADGGFISV